MTRHLTSYDTAPDVRDLVMDVVTDGPTGDGHVAATTTTHRLVLQPFRITRTAAGWAWWVQEWLPTEPEIRDPLSGALVDNPDHPGGSWYTVSCGAQRSHHEAFETGEEALVTATAEREQDNREQQ